MRDLIVEALYAAGYEVDDTDENRVVVLRGNGEPVLEIDWSSCDPTSADFQRIGQALIDASRLSG
jgi:hypothetical protein